MKTILIGLINNYTPKKITAYSVTYDVDIYGEKQNVEINWELKNPEEHKFNTIEPCRKFNVYSNTISSCTYQTPANIRVCYTITIDNLTYNVPLTLEETDYINLLITQLFQKVQNEKLQIIKSVIENEIQKTESADGEQVS